MTLPALPAQGSTNWYSWAQGIDTTVRAGGGGGGGGGTSTTGDFGAVSLDSFSGASDDAKLDAALAAVAADTFPRTIQLSNRTYSFATVNRTPYEGMRIAGPDGYSNPERNSQSSRMAGRVQLTGSGPWFTCGTSTYFQVSLHNLTFTGGSSAYVLGGTTGQFYCLSMRNIFSSNLSSVLGTQSQKLLLTAASFTGDWEINNCYTGAFHLGGSDNVLWSDGMLLDSGTAFNTAGGSNGQYHLWCDSLDKTIVGPLYVTAEGGWNGIRVTGPAYNSTSSNQGTVWFNGLRIEGRNPGAPCNGSLIRVEGGRAVVRDSWIAYGMASATTPGHSPADAGIIHHSGGQLAVHGCTYDRATGVPETVPFVYTISTGDCVVNGIGRASRGGTWTGRPVVARASSAAENRICDATVTQTTI